MLARLIKASPIVGVGVKLPPRRDGRGATESLPLLAAVLALTSEQAYFSEQMQNEMRRSDKQLSVYRAALHLLVAGPHPACAVSDTELETPMLREIVAALCQNVQPQTLAAARLLVHSLLRERTNDTNELRMLLGQTLYECAVQSVANERKSGLASASALMLLQRLEGPEVREHALSAFRSKFTHLQVLAVPCAQQEAALLRFVVAALPEARVRSQVLVDLLNDVQVKVKEWGQMLLNDHDGLQGQPPPPPALVAHVRLGMRLMLTLGRMMKRESAGAYVETLVRLLHDLDLGMPLHAELAELALSCLTQLVVEPERLSEASLAAVAEILGGFRCAQLQRNCLAILPRLLLTPVTRHVWYSDVESGVSGGSEGDGAVWMQSCAAVHARLTALQEAVGDRPNPAPLAAPAGAPGTGPANVAGTTNAPANGVCLEARSPVGLTPGRPHVLVQSSVAARVRCIPGRPAPEPWGKGNLKLGNCWGDG